MSDSQTKTYTPRADSLASLCIGFFTNHPEEHLGLEDISQKFGAVRGNIHSILRPALDAGLLLRERDDDGDYIYRAGPAISTAAPIVSNPHTGAPRDPRDVQTDPGALLCVKPGALLKAVTSHGHKTAAPRGYTRPRHAIDLSALQIEEGVPYMAIQARGKSKWEPLFEKLGKPNQSMAVPGHVKAALAAAAAIRNKQKRGTFKVAMTGPDEARIWRIA